MKLIGSATDGAVRLELWTSFRSLLQAYLAAASIGTEVPMALVVETKPGSMQIVGTLHSIKLELEPGTGEGYWAVYGPQGDQTASAVPSLPEGMLPEGTLNSMLDEGSFRLHLDAQLAWSGKTGLLALDQVAEALAMLVLG